MQGDPQVIRLLQAQLENELTTINQCCVPCRMFKHRGFERMAKKGDEESIGERNHADALMERPSTLDALPSLQNLGKPMPGETLPEALACDPKPEQGAQATSKDAIACCEEVRNFVSRDLFQRILDDTEKHVDFLETQFDVLGKLGEQNDLQPQLGY